MAVPNSKDARFYYRAAFQRLDDGKFLLAGGRTTGAVYLAGYGVECMLKALILAILPDQTHRTTMISSFRGSKAHDFEWLKEQYQQHGGPALPRQIARSLALVNSWSTDLRYHPGTVRQRDAKAFFDAADQIFGWADGRL